ncbi:hypothetical protein F5X96DRAFT_486025 [Biscogniauxia mediterranea]|nr:hypothetical protein F5X96DRAFT_486025 [Biscogniauxia mediterranea]
MPPRGICEDGSRTFLIPRFMGSLTRLWDNCSESQWSHMAIPNIRLDFFTTYLDTIQITYTSNFSNPNLYTFCSDGIETRFKKLAAATSYNGTSPTVLDFTDASSACWFNLRSGSEAGFVSNSDVFEFKIGQRSQTTQVHLAPQPWQRPRAWHRRQAIRHPLLQP